MDLLTALCDAVRCASWHWVLDKLIEGRRRKYETSNDKSRKWSRIKRNGTDDKRLAFLWNGGDLSKQKASRQPRHVIQGRTLCYFWRESGKGPGNRPSLDFMLSSLWGYEDDFRNEPNRRPKCKNDETFWNSGRRFYQNFPTKSESHWHEIGHLACWVCVRGRHIRSGGKNQKEFKPGRTSAAWLVMLSLLQFGNASPRIARRQTQNRRFAGFSHGQEEVWSEANTLFQELHPIVHSPLGTVHEQWLSGQYSVEL